MREPDPHSFARNFFTIIYNLQSYNIDCKLTVMGIPDKSWQWKEGQSGNPNGRPIGARNKYTAAIVQYLQENNLNDPLITLAQIQQNSEDEGIRATAANMLAVYIHPKRGAIPTPPPPQYFEIQFQIPQARNLDQALKNIAYLSELKATGQIDVLSADSLINDNRTIANALVDEAKILAAGEDPSRLPVIRVEGGLPRLLGCDIIMPGDLPAEAWGWTEIPYKANGAAIEDNQDQGPPTGSPEPPPTDQGT